MAFVEVTKKDHIAVVTMNRPEALNALNKAVFTDLEVALDDVEKDDEVYVVIITGAGRAFIAGADIGEMAPMNVAEGLAFSELGNRILMRVDMMEKPTIAAVNGFALGGGCEMALACDIRIASEKAKFGQPEVGLGIIPGFGGTQRMARIIGTGPAMELIYTADTIDAQRALEIGMVNHVVPADQLMDEAMKLAQKICTNAQKAIRASKLAIRRGIDCDISTAVSYEALAFATCFGTEDQKEGMQAFLEKTSKLFSPFAFFRLLPWGGTTDCFLNYKIGGTPQWLSIRLWCWAPAPWVWGSLRFSLRLARPFSSATSPTLSFSGARAC